MPVIHNRYRVVREISATLYCWIFVCEDMQGGPQPARLYHPLSLKSIPRANGELYATPSSRRSCPDTALVQKEVGELVRVPGGHPNFVQYHDSFVEQQTLYLVMEHCADGNIYDYLSKRSEPTLPCMESLSVLSLLAAGLAFLHELGIAHRDASLENVMLHHGRCKLGDFDLATRGFRVGGRYAGKKYYMAPEIVAGDEYDPKKANVWSLSNVLFVLLTGSPLVPLASMSVKSFRVFKQVGVTTLSTGVGSG